MLSLVTAPVPLRGPVSVEELKDFARIDGNDEDAVISDMLTATTRAAEQFTQRAFLSQTWDLTYDGFPTMMRVPLGNLQSVTSISYVDTAGSSQTVTSSDYRVDTTTEPGRITEAVGATWPATQDVTNAVTLRFVAGWTAASSVPMSIRQAIMIGASHQWRCREGGYPDSFWAMLSEYRLFGADIGATA